MNKEKWLLENTESLKGKTVAVTGTTGGIGKELCSYLCSLGASLLLLDRNSERSASHKESLMSRYPDVCIKCIPLDLEDIRSVKDAANAAADAGVDIFIHNAGAYAIPRKILDTGYDNVFQINFASVYYMIRKILPSLRERGGRVVVVGSIAHNYSVTDENDIDFKTRKQSSKVYGNSKRYLMFSLYELFKNEKNVTLAVTHPGITFTGITNHYPKVIFAIIKHPMKVIFMKRDKAALSVLRGVFESTDYCRWIGPCIFNVWGLPKNQSLSTCKTEEIHRISKTAEEVYLRCVEAAGE